MLTRSMKAPIVVPLMRRGQTTRLYLLLILSMLLFGGSWVSGKLLADRAVPAPLIIWRFSIAAMLMIPVLLRTQRNGFPLKRATPKLQYPFVGAVFLAVLFLVNRLESEGGEAHRALHLQHSGIGGSSHFGKRKKKTAPAFRSGPLILSENVLTCGRLQQKEEI